MHHRRIPNGHFAESLSLKLGHVTCKKYQHTNGTRPRNFSHNLLILGPIQTSSWLFDYPTSIGQLGCLSTHKARVVSSAFLGPYNVIISYFTYNPYEPEWPKKNGFGLFFCSYRICYVRCIVSALCVCLEKNGTFFFVDDGTPLCYGTRRVCTRDASRWWPVAFGHIGPKEKKNRNVLVENYVQIGWI